MPASPLPPLTTRRASECIVQFQGMHLLAPRACILGVFIKQLGLSGIQATEVALSNLPIEATKTREEPFLLTGFTRGSTAPSGVTTSGFPVATFFSGGTIEAPSNQYPTAKVIQETNPPMTNNSQLICLRRF